MDEDHGGYVYLLKARKPFEECYKIGRTKDPKRRLHDFGVRLPYKVELIFAFYVSNMYDAEAELHDRFQRLRLDGEWFVLGEAEVWKIRQVLLTIQAGDLCERLGLGIYQEETLAGWEAIERRLELQLKTCRRFLRRLKAVNVPPST